MRKAIFTFLFTMVTAICCQAQSDFVISGQILSSDSLQPIFSTHVISRMSRMGTISNYEGRFRLKVSCPDTLWVSNVGFKRILVAIDSSTLEKKSILVLLDRDTTQLEEVEVRAFYDYRTFKYLIVNMPTPKSPNLYTIDEELANSLVGIEARKDQTIPVVSGLSPIQALYDAYNKKSRRERRLMRNRREFNEILRAEGRLDELLSDTLEYIIDRK